MRDGDGSRDEPFSERWIWGMWGRSFHGLPTTLIFYATKPHAMHGQLGGWMEGRKSLGFILDGIWIDASQHGVLGDWTALDRIEKIPERLWNFDGQIDRQTGYLLAGPPPILLGAR